MRPESKDLDRILDDAIDGIREERIDDRGIDEAAARVWERVATESRTVSTERSEHREGAGPILDCDGYQALIPAFLTDSLNDARRLLLDDHLRECVPCRRALKQARRSASGKAVPDRPAGRPSRTREWSWAVAAAVLVTVALVGLRIDIPGVVTFRTGGVVTVEQSDGPVFRVNQAGTFPVPLGQPLQLEDETDRLRTAKGTRAVLKLSDGSLVEMKERSQLSVTEQRSRLGGERKSSTIDLDRGSVIVEAADQQDGRLFVETDDCTVEVKGTVFSVNHGTKGSRISVIEGEVKVDLVGGSDVLQPGEQAVTGSAMARIPVADEIAWSQNVDRHLALLRELTDLGRELDETIQAPAARFSTRLLDRAPAGTVVYATIPNLGSTLNDAYSQLRAKVDSNPVLQAWWQQSVVSVGADRQLDEAITRLRDFGEQFGDEIVFTLQTEPGTGIQEPLILAELARPSEFRDFLLGQLDDLGQAHGGAAEPHMVILEGPGLAAAGGIEGDFYVWINDGLFAASPSIERIRPLAASTRPAAAIEFRGSDFHRRLAEQYREGVQWMLGVDLATVMGPERGRGSEQVEVIERLGLMDLQHLIVERHDFGGRSDTRAELTFSQDRRGVTAWLAAPAPMGSLEFISPDPAMAAAFVMKDPATMIDELLAVVGSGDEVEEALAGFEQEFGVDLRDDFAATLGGEFALAIDGPLLPDPSWKFVVEVYDPQRLQQTLEWTVERVDRLLGENGSRGLKLETSESGGRTFHALESLDTGIDVHYVMTDGYLVAAASRALLKDSLTGREAGHTLPRSHRFNALLPQDSEINFSAVGYQNLGGLLGPLLQGMRGVAERLGPEQAALAEEISRNTCATLAFAYGEADRITVAATSRGGLFSSGLSLFSLQSLTELEKLIDAAAAGPEPGS